MSLKNRLIIILNFVLLISVVIGFVSVILSAKNSVRSEIESSISLAMYAIETGVKKNPEFYLFKKNSLDLKLISNIRHLSIKFLDRDNHVIDQNIQSESFTSPLWFRKIFSMMKIDLDEIKIPIYAQGKFLGKIEITPRPEYEYDEIWTHLINGLYIALFLFLLINISVLFILNKLINPINALINGFKSLADGSFKVINKSYGISEIDLLRKQFNKLAMRLSADNEKIHALNQELLNTQEKERAVISKDLHDELGQSLVAMQMELLSGKSIKTISARNKHLDKITLQTKELMSFTRNLIKRLSLMVLDDMDFESALKDLMNNWRLKNPRVIINENVKIKSNIQKELKQAIYRILQESLTNISKHSAAKKIIVALNEKENRLYFKIENDYPKTIKVGNGFGILGIQERVKNLKGQFEYKLTKNKFFITISIPFQ